MSELQAIESALEQARSRRRWQRAWRGLWRGLLAGAVVLLLALGAYKLFPMPIEVLGAAGALFGLLALGGAVTGWWRRERLVETARWVDERNRLRERVSTAVEVGSSPTAGSWGELVVHDAAKHMAGLDLRKLLPFSVPQASRWVLLVLALGAGLGFVPEYRSEKYLQEQQEAEIIRESGERLADLTRRTLARRDPALQTTREALESVGELGKELSRNPTTRNEALRELAKMTEGLNQQSKELERKRELAALKRANHSSGRSDSATAEQLKKQMDALQKSMGGRQPDADALDKLRDKLAKAMEAAQGMLGKNSAGDPKAMENLAQALSNLARESGDLGAALSGLEEAMASLKEGDIDRVMKNLEIAEQDLEKMMEMAKALQQLQKQSQQLGKDLAEQLERGQAEAARGTLLKMANQLKGGKLTPEELEALMEAVGEAVDPAKPYGKVAELLDQAVKEMKSGQQPQASQSLAKAAKELGDLMQQMADAQALSSAIEALKRAQMCIGNGQCWGKVPGSGRPGFKPGGKPSQGVGTWGDDSNWYDTPPQNELADNSGIERPDMDARGETDRGEPQLPDSLLPTRVKGQFNPGGQMPSITLRGVSIKGESRVAVQEAFQAAQSQAQAALSQERVPRAYQGAVKDYFDDLKE